MTSTDILNYLVDINATAYIVKGYVIEINDTTYTIRSYVFDINTTISTLVIDTTDLITSQHGTGNYNASEVNESAIADEMWNRDVTEHTTPGTFGQLLNEVYAYLYDIWQNGIYCNN